MENQKLKCNTYNNKQWWKLETNQDIHCIIPVTTHAVKKKYISSYKIKEHDGNKYIIKYLFRNNLLSLDFYMFMFSKH